MVEIRGTVLTTRRQGGRERFVYRTGQIRSSFHDLDLSRYIHFPDIHYLHYLDHGS